MGSKNLRAVAALGSNSIKFHDSDFLKQVAKNYARTFRDNPLGESPDGYTDRAQGTAYDEKAERRSWRALTNFLEELFAGPFEERRPRMAKTLALREEPLLALHQTQISKLAEWRQNGRTEEDAIFDELLLITNAIASGLRTTG